MGSELGAAMSTQKRGQVAARPQGQSRSLSHQRANLNESPDDLSTLGQAALEYARRGFGVIPCKPRGKGPLLSKEQGGRGVHDATTDEKVILEWWRRYPDANIGLVPPSGMVVVDVDPQNGGTADGLPPTLTQSAGQGGEHRLYRNAPKRLPGKLRTGVDIKTNGHGYILAEPSIHPNGKVYHWLHGFDPTKVTPFPVELTIFDTEERVKTNGVDRGEWTGAQLDAALAQIESDSYDDWIEVGMVLRAVYGDDEFPRWMEWSRGSDKFPGEEACWKKWQSFNRHEKGLGSLAHMLKVRGEQIPRTDARDDFDVYRGEGVSYLKTTPFTEIEERRVEWLVPGYVARGILHCVAGLGGEGKSSALSALVAALTRGVNWIDKQPLACGPTSVAIITEEPIAYQTRPRLRLAGADIDRVLKVEGIVTTKGELDPWNLVDHEKKTREFLKLHPEVQLLLIDPIGNYMNGRGNRREINTWKDSDVRIVLSPWQRVAEELNIAIIYIAHHGKGKAERMMNLVTGSGAFTTVTRMSYAVIEPPQGYLDQYGFGKEFEGGDDLSGHRVMFATKVNIGPSPQPVVFKFEHVPDNDNPKVTAIGILPRIKAEELQEQMRALDKEMHTPLQDRILEFVKGHPGETKNRICELLGVQATNESTQRAFNQLVAKFKIKLVKAPKGSSIWVFDIESGCAELFN